MIDWVDLSRFPCFGNDESLSDLAAVNYVFGPNGSGKTTISQSLATVGADDSHVRWVTGRQTVKVYNRDYVRNAFTNADGEERGVFLLGEDSGDTFAQIEELEKQCEKTKKRIRTRQEHIRDEEASLAGRRNELAGKVWERRSVIPEIIKHEMTGLNGSRAKCLELVLDKAREFPERGEEAFESLVSKVEAAFSKTVSERDSITQAPAVSWDEDALKAALSAPIIGSSDVPLAEMIEQLGISDWVQQGAGHLDGQEGSPVLCPFCQQVAPEDLSGQLASIFDDTYQRKRDEIEAFQRDTAEVAGSLAAYKDKNLKALQDTVDSSEVDLVFAAVEVGIERISTSVEHKLLKPSDVVDVDSVAAYFSALKSVVETANGSIGDANAIVRNRKEQRPVILNAAWQEFVRGHLGDLVNAFFADEKKSKTKTDGLAIGIEKQEGLLRDFEAELRGLRAQTTSSEATIQTINDLLAMSQFHSFKLEKARRTNDGYRIIRDGGELADVNTLSEGERTFITFLYFFHSLSEVRQDGETETVSAVIDDPVSSLDGDIMFVVSALTRELIRGVRKGQRGRVSQVILLTHNTRFHNEVSYEHKGEESSKIKFYRIRKYSPEPNRIEDCGQKNPIRSAYQELWDEVATARKRPDSPMPWLPNVLRRILESYFSTLGGQGNLYEIGQDLVSTQRAHHDALIAWSHSGSHTIVDAEVYSQPSSSNGQWLGAFERIFENMSNGAHWGHYEMMMGEARKYVA